MLRLFTKTLNFAKIQKFSKAIMLPISILPIAGLLLGIASALSNPTTVLYINDKFTQELMGLFKAVASSIFSNIPLIFSVGVAVGIAKNEKGVAALNAIVAYLIFNVTINYYLKVNNKLVAPSEMASVGQTMIFGVQTLATGIFGAMILGVIVAHIQNRFGKKQLPKYLGFFSGPRFIPFLTIPISVCLAILAFNLWPGINGLITSFGLLIAKLGVIGSFLLLFFHRLLVPLGLHHILAFPFAYTSLGGTMIINDQVYEGTRNIFFAELADPNTTKFYSGLARYGSGGYYIVLMFGLPGAAYGIFKGLVFSDQKKLAALLFTGALTSFLTGITEPLEFLFVFTAPLLYFIHCFYTGIIGMFGNIFDITVGNSFSTGFLDFLVFGILQGNAKTNWIWVPILGVPFFFLYYFTFKKLYNYFDFGLTGVTDPIIDSNLDQTEYLKGKAGQLESFGNAKRIIKGLGGLDNIEELDSCATRLRVTVLNYELIDKNLLTESGALKVTIINNGVQIIYGADVYFIRSAIEEYYPEKFFGLSGEVSNKTVKDGVETYKEIKEDEKGNEKKYTLNKDFDPKKPNKDDFKKF